MPLRNPNINYNRGWFFVTTQVAHNKTMFGVIAGEQCRLNELGKMVEQHWSDFFKFHPEFEQDEFVVMPNHFHAIIRAVGGSGKSSDLSGAMRIFKSLAANEYLKLKKSGRCPDIGSKLWLSSYYDNLITSERELLQIRRYIRENPARWDRDRFGPVTTHHIGNLELLREKMVAFVASEGGWGVGATPHPHDRKGIAPGGAAPRNIVPGGAAPRNIVPGGAAPRNIVPGGASPGGIAPGGATPRNIVPGGASPPPVISTFTSSPEQSVLAKCLAVKRPYVHVMPGGIPEVLPSAWKEACREGRALLLSPVPAGTGVNKQRAIWCNRYVLDHAGEIWHGYIRPGGTLETLLGSKE
jgi:putative transposase